MVLFISAFIRLNNAMESNNGVPERSMSRRLKKVRQKLTPEEKQRRKELRLAKKILQQKTLIRV